MKVRDDALSDYQEVRQGVKQDGVLHPMFFVLLFFFLFFFLLFSFCFFSIFRNELLLQLKTVQLNMYAE